ncbi:hypothetical protein [Amycolatopsis panacis]|uniref:hypothetical protein n=1 Tax=Amycolatopsis panacis TaxID=2340917 RepID=UPI0011C3D5DB|nr:hypothetical protein [Amycolatopsis panacis]
MEFHADTMFDTMQLRRVGDELEEMVGRQPKLAAAVLRRMLRVIGIESVKVLRDESDEYVELSLEWRPDNLATTPASCFVRDRSGSEGGYVQVRVEPLAGEVYSVVMVIRPVVVIEVPSWSSMVTESGMVRLDLASWPGDPGRSGAAEALSRVDWVSDLAIGENEHGAYLALFAVPPVRWVMSGDAGFGIGAGGELTGVRYEGNRFGEVASDSADSSRSENREPDAQWITTPVVQG